MLNITNPDGQLPPEESKIIGTPMYWALEQTFARKAVTPALDIWAVGVLMFHLSSGATALRVNLNVQGCGIVAPPMHASSRTPLLLPLLLSHNLPTPRVH